MKDLITIEYRWRSKFNTSRAMLKWVEVFKEYLECNRIADSDIPSIMHALYSGDIRFLKVYHHRLGKQYE